MEIPGYRTDSRRYAAIQLRRVVSVIRSRGKLSLVAICVSIGVGALAVQALGSFGPARHFSTGNHPSGIAVGKVNRDRHPDLVVVSGDNVAVLLGNGAGGGGAAKHFAAGDFPSAVAIGDLNSDGKPDLAVADYLSNNVSILLGHGDGTFGKAKSFAAGDEPSSIAIGDFNGDNRRDLAVANFFGHNGNSVSILLGHGDGTFGAPTDYRVGKLPTSVAIGKLNGDGKLDLAVANRASDSVSILLGHGDGTFGKAKSFAAGDGATSIAAGRLNGDSRLDLATANYNANSVAVLSGKGDGTFGKAKSFAVGIHPTSVAIGNLNGDPHPDLAVANQNSNTVSVLPGRGDGSFGVATGYPLRPRPANPQAVAIGNFNADARPDLAVATETSKGVSVLLNAGPSARMLTLAYSRSKRRFTGRLSSADSICVEGQGVRVLRRRPGRDKTVGAATTTISGSYSIRRNARQGTYYARVGAWSACRTKSSRAITID